MHAEKTNEWRGFFFDGASSVSRPVFVTRADGGTLRVREDGQEDRMVPPNAYSLAAPVGKGPVCLRLSDGGMIQLVWCDELIRDFAGSISRRNRMLSVVETRLGLCLSVVASACLALVCGYVYGVPAFANFVAPRLSPQFKSEIGDHAMHALDEFLFEASTLNAKKKDLVSRVVERLEKAAQFSSTIDSMTRNMVARGKSIPNALALLPNRIIATDKIVEMLDERELEAVLAHEVGHLHYDHSTKTLVRVSFVSLLAVMIFGGDPGVFQSLALNLVDAKNSRDNERQADEYAVRLLKSMSQDPMALHKALTKISEGHSESSIRGFLSSHPLTADRLQFIQEFAGR